MEPANRSGRSLKQADPAARSSSSSPQVGPADRTSKSDGQVGRAVWTSKSDEQVPCLVGPLFCWPLVLLADCLSGLLPSRPLALLALYLPGTLPFCCSLARAHIRFIPARANASGKLVRDLRRRFLNDIISILKVQGGPVFFANPTSRTRGGPQNITFRAH